ncbi:hypothetical protein [Pseudomonas sp. USHLN015]|uniref:hypothetical protein n=1 Tax=Pseudomonas sp. USHLN015 TaxID=3081296 RepID=UPI00301C2470
MKWIKRRWLRWKEKHWDDDFFTTDGDIPWAGITRPPLRRAWEEHKHQVIPAVKWLAGLVIGALILAAIGLG